MQTYYAQLCLNHIYNFFLYFLVIFQVLELVVVDLPVLKINSNIYLLVLCLQCFPMEAPPLISGTLQVFGFL